MIKQVTFSRGPALTRTPHFFKLCHLFRVLDDTAQENRNDNLLEQY